MKKYTLCTSLLLLAVLIWPNVACTAKHAQPDLKILDVLSDFTFVGSAPYTAPEKGKEANQEIALQQDEPQPLPKHLELGRAYVFRHHRPFDDEKLGLSYLPSRLRTAGLRILQAPQSPRDLIASYIGGPFFVIKFTDGRYTGLFTNRLSPDYQKQVDSGWTGEDYILVYTQ